ncbi:unnamed protein product [Protopolystoma xenopodis]|uniref:Uncharacterized protein n=1 Tax=Protopolystoma xenopodis TaxID=117903 RepID=A0A3S5AF86_9PLAT|nr:unnamed protein product [Protopolystoma xenopodis]
MSNWFPMPLVEIPSGLGACGVHILCPHAIPVRMLVHFAVRGYLSELAKSERKMGNSAAPYSATQPGLDEED